MKTIYIIFLFLILLCSDLLSQVSSYSFQSSSSVFIPEIGGTVLGNSSNDEQVFNNNTTGETGPQSDIGFPIGFNFFYNGAFYNRFAVNNNGWINLGIDTLTIGATTSPISYSNVAGFANIISAFGRDLQGQTGSELSYKLIGTAPNRVMVIQWLNFRRYNIALGDGFSFQIRLNESDNSVSFVYGIVTTTNTSTSTSVNTTQVGIRGAVNSDYKNRTTTTSWSSSSAGTINTNTMRLTTTVKPASGLEYKWTPAAMSYVSSTTLAADSTNIKKNSINNVIIKMQVVTGGITTPLNATKFVFSTNGTTSTSDISNAKVWYTGTSPVFNASQQFGSVLNNPNGSFTINGTQALQTGTNYFWLTYDVPSSAVTGNLLDAECNTITVGSNRTPTVQAPAGSCVISDSPMEGVYTVGLQLFEKALGKELHFKKSTIKAFREFYSKNTDNNSKQPSNDEYKIAEGLSRELRQVETDTFILMDGNVPYSGPNCIEITSEVKARLGSSYRSDMSGIFANITAAFNDVNYRGVDGPVTLLLTDETYNSETFPLTLSQVNGLSSSNTLLIKPAPDVSCQVNMSSGTSLIKIYDSEYITIDGSNWEGGTSRDLSLYNNSTSISYGIWAGSVSGKTVNNITVKNCIIRTGENSQGSVPILFADASNSSSAGYFNNVNITNNVLQKGRMGVFLHGGIIPQCITNVTMANNVVTSAGTDAIGYIGLYMQGVNGGLVSNNHVGNLDPAGNDNDKGIWIANGSHDVRVERNKVFNIGYTGTSGNGGHGIYLSANHVNAYDTLCNNVIYNIYGDGWNYLDQIFYLDNPTGIVLYSSTPQSGISVLNNSINLYGNTLKNPYAISFGVFASSNATFSLLNNVICNNLGVLTDTAYGSCAVFAQNSHSQFSFIDYNNYYVNPTGNGEKTIGKISSTRTSTSLNNWRGVTFQDRSSINYDPGFTSNTDLAPLLSSSNVWSLNGKAQQNASVHNDFNGNSRSITVPAGEPDIGAYEFTPSSQPPSITGIGAISNGGSTLYILGSDTLASIVWHGSNLPSSVTLRFYSGTTPPSPNTGNYGNCYWQFIPTGGSGYTFDMTLFWDPASIGSINGVGNITIANYTSSVWEHYAASVNTTARTVTHNGLSKLSVFTIDDNTLPMPVTLMYFDHTVSGRDAILKWATSSEINNKGFEIERNSDLNTEWKKIAFVPGRGTTNEETVYGYTDKNLSTGTYNYRLKQIDYSGSSEYYNISSPVVIGKPSVFSLSQNYPNPSNPKAKIDYQVPVNTNLSIKVYDIKGSEIQTLFEGYSEAGYYSVEFDGASLSSGVYFYRIQSEQFSKTMKMILVK